MTETIVKSINYEKSDNIEFQGTEKEAQNYIKKGYNIRLRRNGYFVVGKPCKINVTLAMGNALQQFNMRSDILDHYGKEKMTKALFEKFKKDIEKGNINLKLHSKDEYSFN